ncbi:hypothetical protein Syun_027469 [Stephania yunnanensis]|uniref:Uncharacterized protein n=1 Tax=Stephania yunnanensis TaxID=152371 RepID=A0AAP0EMY7_9MAGN
MGHALRFLSRFLAGLAMGHTLSKKGEAAYIFENENLRRGKSIISYSTNIITTEIRYSMKEEISQVRTVYSFVGEDKAVHTYSNLLTNALKLGEEKWVCERIWPRRDVCSHVMFLGPPPLASKCPS